MTVFWVTIWPHKKFITKHIFQERILYEESNFQFRMNVLSTKYCIVSLKSLSLMKLEHKNCLLAILDLMGNVHRLTKARASVAYLTLFKAWSFITPSPAPTSNEISWRTREEPEVVINRQPGSSLSPLLLCYSFLPTMGQEVPEECLTCMVQSSANLVKCLLSWSLVSNMTPTRA